MQTIRREASSALVFRAPLEGRILSSKRVRAWLPAHKYLSVLSSSAFLAQVSSCGPTAAPCQPVRGLGTVLPAFGAQKRAPGLQLERDEQTTLAWSFLRLVGQPLLWQSGGQRALWRRSLSRGPLTYCVPSRSPPFTVPKSPGVGIWRKRRTGCVSRSVPRRYGADVHVGVAPRCASSVAL